MLRVAALVPYHADSCAGQRFRIELWARRLRERGIEIELVPFSDEALARVLYARGAFGRKALELARCYAAQLLRVARTRRPDVVYLYREAALLGPPLLEQLARRWRAPVVYDLDEPLFQPYRSPSNGMLTRLKFFSKYDRLIASADRVWVVNEALAAHARRHAQQVELVPMAVDTEVYLPAQVEPPARPFRVGWMGTRTSQKNLQVLAAPLRRLAASLPTELRVLADEPLEMPGVDLRFSRWTAAEELAALQQFHAGVVPVLRDEWSAWKFYFKLVQLMAAGLPVVASAEGSNLEIIAHGRNGFLARDEDEWYAALGTLAREPGLRREVGAAARRSVLERFSLTTQLDFVERSFRQLA